MIDIQFEIDGKAVKINNIADALERAMFDTIAENLRTTLGGMRDPDTGEFPTVVVRGSSLENMAISVEGSDAVVALATERLQEDFDVTESPESDAEPGETPYVFLCHASEDKPLVERLATDLRANGWKCSLISGALNRETVFVSGLDEGIIECSHFVVLLTKTSLDKPWVNAEIDAGFVKKLNGQCKFVPLRCDLEASELPPLLSGLNAPELNDYDADLRALIGFFFGVTQKPPLGAPPAIMTSQFGEMGISAAAKRLVDLVMAGTKHGVHMDPQISAEELRTTSNLTDDEIEDAVFELEGRGLLCRHTGSNSGPLGFIRVVPEDTLFEVNAMNQPQVIEPATSGRQYHGLAWPGL